MPIRNLQEARDTVVFHNQAFKDHHMKLVSGYEIVRQDGSTQCQTRFTAKKAMTINEHTYDLHSQSRIKTRNITLWNKIDNIDGKFQRLALKVLIIFACVLHPPLALLPIADWLIGHVRRDQEILSFHKHVVNPTSTQPNPVVHAVSHNRAFKVPAVSVTA